MHIDYITFIVILQKFNFNNTLIRFILKLKRVGVFLILIAP